jgi:hypothetical protein
LASVAAGRQSGAIDCAGGPGGQPPAYTLACENERFHETTREFHVMDIEQINAIGANLADLSQRTQDLRGYL